MKSLSVCLCLVAGASFADTVVAARTIQARTILAEGDMRVVEGTVSGAVTDPAVAAGLETKATLYEGRPILAAYLVSPALIERNEIVSLAFKSGPLLIRSEGRVLDRAGLGERVRVMNLGSRITVTGTVIGPGQVSVP